MILFSEENPDPAGLHGPSLPIPEVEGLPAGLGPVSERLYQSYRKDRDDGLSHAQIVAEGVYGSEVESFALRYSLAVSAYAEAMQRRDQLKRLMGDPSARGFAPDGRPL